MKFYYMVSDHSRRAQVIIGKYQATAYANEHDQPDKEVGIALALMRANRNRILERQSARVQGNALHGWRIAMKQARLRHANAWAARFIAYVSEKRGKHIALSSVSAKTYELSAGVTLTFYGKPARFERIQAEEQFVRQNIRQILADIEWIES